MGPKPDEPTAVDIERRFVPTDNPRIGGCPRCNQALSGYRRGQVDVLLCRRCRGLFMLGDGAREVYGDAADPRRWVENGIATRIGASPLNCPGHRSRTPQMDLYMLEWQRKRLSINACLKCGGVWLDPGSGRKVASMMSSVDRSRQDAEDAMNKRDIFRYLFQATTMMPVEVWNPVRRRPIMAFTLIGLLAGIFILQVIFDRPFWLATFGLTPQSVVSEPWTLLSYAFLHASLAHITFNLYFLHVFGDNIEDRFGRGWFLSIFALAVAAGGAAHVVAAEPTLTMSGASAGVSGLIGAYAVAFPRSQMLLVVLLKQVRLPTWVYVLGWTGLQFGMAWLGHTDVAWYAHLAGAAVGVVLGLWLRRTKLSAIERREEATAFDLPVSNSD